MPRLIGDRSLGEGDKDRLGFRETARRIATSITNQAVDDGLVVGLEGKWGSGKSSMLYLIEEALVKLPIERRPTIINFRPWIVGNRDVLLGELFTLLGSSIDQIAAGSTAAAATSIKRAKTAAKAFRLFTSGLHSVGSLAEFAGSASSFAPLKWLGTGIRRIAQFLKLARPDKLPLDQSKGKLKESLRNLGHRFIVTIDDLDRLEPREALEVLRLVRSVADFPNVVYLLCYDSEILAQSVAAAAQVPEGHAYLEKFVQLSIMVPEPETFQLRNWFAADLSTIASVKNEDESGRLRSVIDLEGGFRLRTPRAVVRTLDAIRFYWPPLQEAKADLADLVWLQLIKYSDPPLYRWIETYCGTAAAVSLVIGRVDDSERQRKCKELHGFDSDTLFRDQTYRFGFAEKLLGVSAHLDSGQAGEPYFDLFEDVSQQTMSPLIADCRLASPDHYKLYFALQGPTHVLTQEDFDAVWGAIGAGSAAAAKSLQSLHMLLVGGDLSKADLLLERILGNSPSALGTMQRQHLLEAFADAMDDMYRCRPFDIGWGNSIWSRAERLVKPLLAPSTDSERRLTLRAMFRDGRAIGWLTSIFRHETWAHGRSGDRPRAESDRLFNSAELDEITGWMLGRYGSMTIETLFDSPHPLGILFAWRQAGDGAGPRELISSNIISDERLLYVLEHMTSTIVSSERGEYPVLKRENVEPFADYEDAVRRVTEIANRAPRDLLAARALKLVKAIVDESWL